MQLSLSVLWLVVPVELGTAVITAILSGGGSFLENPDFRVKLECGGAASPQTSVLLALTAWPLIILICPAWGLVTLHSLHARPRRDRGGWHRLQPGQGKRAGNEEDP